MNEIVTLGYSHKDAGSVLGDLTGKGYHIIDIRLSAASKVPGYSHAELQATYGKIYHWVNALGNINHNSHSDYVAIKNWESGYERLKRAYDRAPLILLCGCRYAETCHRWYISQLLEKAIPGLQVRHLLQNDHAGMIKHHNARIDGACHWTENGQACQDAGRVKCVRCRGSLCDLHQETTTHWEKLIHFCPDCHENYQNERAEY